MSQPGNSIQEQMFQPEIITFGESMALMMPENTKGIEYSSQFQSLFGGAESNVAIGVSRLGRRVGWFGRLGKDPFGRMILKKIRGEGVEVSRAELTAEAPTGLMLREVVSGKTSVYYYRKGSAASLMRPEHLDEAYIKQAKYLHVTGITMALSQSARETVKEAVRLAKKHGVRVCFDPNLRLKLWTIEEARGELLEMAKEADFFLPGLDELKLLYQTENFDEITAKLRELPGVSIVKGGDEVTYIVEKTSLTEVPYFKAERVVDTVGAGDGFCAGFFVGLLKDYGLPEAVRLGNLIGCMVVQTEGDWEGIPTWEQVEAYLNNEKHVER
ncbi:2-dehydro-3-deoxygluconokinase [Paenibacillus sp. UNCCL117]|uniref:sugar kinase n=1 Tax=unclassified Paenibacillus TaxID=185978 RepID=UPI0008818F6E|nr:MULTISPECIES: sugar kinase [unclassified Paenibacillus]SDD89256.1 2-dehydro-3-deoxygluconokinase [Paenibacillus sp. cl123]SFW44212.1 2-dehydro-3-deoxygluconokinase [Paenibacillus sp. UNCCL117]